MARALKGTLTLCLALGLTTIAAGQAQNPQAAALLGPVLADPDVQKELKVSDKQLDQLKDALGKVLDKHKDDFLKLQKMSLEEQQKTMKALGEDHHKAVSGVLDATQWKRFKQIEWQRSGMYAFQDPDLQKELKLSDEQKKKLDNIVTDVTKKIQELAKNGERSLEKYKAVGQDAEKKSVEVLNEDQKKKFEELKGTPFQPAPQKSLR